MTEKNQSSWPGATADPKSVFVSIPLTDDEVQVVQTLRRLKPYGAMKIAKNQNGAKLTVTVEESFVVEVKFPT